jgi:transcriptional regulator with XRE-family HTH domain
MASLLEQLRNIIQNSGQSRYAIAKATGIHESALSRFMSNERGLTIEAVETLVDYLGLEIVIRSKGKKRTTNGKH